MQNSACGEKLKIFAFVEYCPKKAVSFPHGRAPSCVISRAETENSKAINIVELDKESRMVDMGGGVQGKYWVRSENAYSTD